MGNCSLSSVSVPLEADVHVVVCVRVGEFLKVIIPPVIPFITSIRLRAFQSRGEDGHS